MTDQEAQTIILQMQGLQKMIEDLDAKLDATSGQSPTEHPEAEGEPDTKTSVHTRDPEADRLAPTKQSTPEREKYLRERGLL